MEAKHTGDKILFEQVDLTEGVAEEGVTAEDATSHDAGCQAILVTLRWKPEAGQVLFSVLECLRKVVSGMLRMSTCTVTDALLLCSLEVSSILHRGLFE